MIFPSNYEEKCGFTAIREMLKELCLGSLGIEKVDELTFHTNFELLVHQLEQVEEMRGLVERERRFPLTDYSDTRTTVQQVIADATSWLTIEEVLAIQQTLVNGKQLYEVVTQQVDDQYLYPKMTLLAKNYVPLEELVEAINQVVDQQGQVRDSASKELASIRKEKIQIKQTIQKKFDSLWRKAQAAGLIDQETPSSMRDGRMVIPITASFKRRFKGVIHDESRSGKTVFIEPEELVSENTRLFVLEQEERREIVRLLVELTRAVRQSEMRLYQLYTLIGTVDFIRAKAILAQKIGGIKPLMVNQPLVDWKQAHHPILALHLRAMGQVLHPLTIRLTGDHRILVVSGANSGGKSVTLKTVALLQYMLQCGLLIPIDTTSTAGIFEQLFMDIGDGQSMENNLSTYTSHLTTMQFFLTQAHAQTLILIDEFGGGTEPELGGAIAESILEQLNEQGCFGLITTHFYNLKGFAQRTPGLENGAMLYDFKEMKPLYQLSQGHPGSSYALDVARRIGLSETILYNASQKIDANYLAIEEELQRVIAEKVAQIQQLDRSNDGNGVQENNPDVEIDSKQKKQLVAVSEIPQWKEENPSPLQIGDTVILKNKKGILSEIRGKKAIILIENMKFTLNLDEIVRSKT
ncbi:DNA mismatch repair protein MutS [Myroides odoratus]|uniref:endonuclease MutS2 n=1 Tax=Myroides odoratus TaxID=256 RepID=UPI0033407E3C